MTSPFSKPTLIALIAVAAISLVVTVVLTVLGDDLGEQTTAGSDGYSVSAIGHRGLVQLLEELDIPVVVSRSDSASKARDGLLIIAEPVVTDPASRDRLRLLIEGGAPTLVVLPKWYGSAERGAPWIENAFMEHEAEITPVLKMLSLEEAALERRSKPVGLVLADGLTTPAIREPQLVRTELDHVLAADLSEAVLLGKVRDGLYLLSDPDVLNNFGLRAPANARFTIQMIDRLRDGGPVVIDETMHGYAQHPSLLRTLFRFPLVLATLQVLICASLAVWAAMVRFGPQRAAPPPIAPGKDFLIRNTAALLHYGGHHAHALVRYLQLTVGAVRHALHAPALAPTAMTAWLERVRLARGGAISLVELERAVETADSQARAVEVADQVFRWRMEMTHGTDSRS